MSNQEAFEVFKKAMNAGHSCKKLKSSPYGNGWVTLQFVGIDTETYRITISEKQFRKLEEYRIKVH